MPFVGTGHIWLLLIVLALVLIVKGPGKLPEMGAGMGRALREFRGAMHSDPVHQEPLTHDAPPADAADPAAH